MPKKLPFQSRKRHRGHSRRTTPGAKVGSATGLLGSQAEASHVAAG
jgi:hypothetical protein